MILKDSELILNSDGSIYHLNLLPEDISDTIITVGDPERVSCISKYFDTIEVSKQKREFKTITGTYKGKRITVISTGIGTDNIDIVLNELDALVNIDLKTRTINKVSKSLDIIRIGTSASILKNIPINTFLLSELAIGFDSLLHFYKSKHIQKLELSKSFMKHICWSLEKSNPYAVSSNIQLANLFNSEQIRKGLTITNPGFYGPQSRALRLELENPELMSKLTSFEYDGIQITNLEMETAGIYGLANLLGHRAVSISVILANRITGKFSENPDKLVDDLIVYCLTKLTTQS